MDYGGFIIDQIGSKLICFGSNGVVVFIGLQIGVAIQSKSKVALFVTIYMHCMAQQTDLVVEVFSTQLLVSKLKGLL